MYLTLNHLQIPLFLILLRLYLSCYFVDGLLVYLASLLFDLVCHFRFL